MRCSLFLAMPILIGSIGIHANDVDNGTQSLLVGTWGGPYETAQRNALFKPFKQVSGITIQTSDYTGGLDVFEETSIPDILDMLEDEAEVACRAGLLKPIDHTGLSEATTFNRLSHRIGIKKDDFSIEDFHKQAFAPCSVAHLSYSTLIA